MLIDKRILLIIETTTPLFNCGLTKTKERSLPFALMISFMGLQKRQLYLLPIGAPTLFRVLLDLL
jgi:hypothetical protein